MLLGGHSGCRGDVCDGFSLPIQVPPKRNRKPRFSPPVRGFSLLRALRASTTRVLQKQIFGKAQQIEWKHRRYLGEQDER
jgi:hypothetical protein